MLQFFVDADLRKARLLIFRASVHHLKGG